MNKLLIFAILGLAISGVTSKTLIKSEKWQITPGMVITPNATDKNFLSTDAILGGSVSNIYGDQPGNVSLYVVTPSKLAPVGILFHTYEVNSANINYANAHNDDFKSVYGKADEVSTQSIATQNGYWFNANIGRDTNVVTLRVSAKLLNATKEQTANVTEIVSLDSRYNYLWFGALWGQASRFGIAYVVNGNLLYGMIPNSDKDQARTLLANLTDLFPNSESRVIGKVACNSASQILDIAECSFVTITKDNTTKITSTNLYRASFLGGSNGNAKPVSITECLTNITHNTNITDLRQTWSNKDRYTVVTTVNSEGFPQVTAIAATSNATTVLNNGNSAKNLTVYSVEPYFDGLVVFYKYPETNSTVYRTYHTEKNLVADNSETEVLKNNTIFKTFVNQRWELFAIFDNQTEAGQLDSIYVGQIFKSVDGSFLKTILSFTASIMIAVFMF